MASYQSGLAQSKPFKVVIQLKTAIKRQTELHAKKEAIKEKNIGLKKDQRGSKSI